MVPAPANDPPRWGGWHRAYRADQLLQRRGSPPPQGGELTGPPTSPDGGLQPGTLKFPPTATVPAAPDAECTATQTGHRPCIKGDEHTGPDVDPATDSL